MSVFVLLGIAFLVAFFFDGKLTLAVATAAAILFSNSDSILTVLSDSVWRPGYLIAEFV